MEALDNQSFFLNSYKFPRWNGYIDGQKFNCKFAMTEVKQLLRIGDSSCRHIDTMLKNHPYESKP